jgi:SDR family mycofactocin-dependent oxidoreductase
MSARAEFEGRVAFVTGAAHGQGRAVALALAVGGADIVALDVASKIEYPAYAQGSSAELDSLKAEVEALGRRALVFAADVRDAAAVQSAVEETIRAFGRIDVLFNNAGIVAYAALDEMTELEWDSMIDINLKGPFLVARAVVPHMKKAGRGVIVNNSSVMGLRGGNRLSHYVASKHGLTGLTKAWAIELAPHGIRVVSIHPTGVNTPMNDGLAELEGATALEIAERSAGNLLPGVPWIETEDVAELVLYLASDRARYATGAQFTLDAGLLTR